MNLNILEELFGSMGPRRDQSSVPEMAPMGPEEEEYIPPITAPGPRRGMFGIRGRGRNILGTIGDAFLVQGGADPVYAPRRQMEREGDAMAGFTDNPLESIGRLARENPEAAREFYNEFIDNQRLGQTEARLQQDHEFDRNLRVNDIALSLLRRANEGNYGMALERARRFYEQNGVEPMFELPDEYDQEFINSISGVGMTPYQEQMLDLNRDKFRTTARQAEERIGQGRQRIQQTDRRINQAEIPNSEGRIYADIVRRQLRGERVNSYEDRWAREYERRRTRGGRRPTSNIPPRPAEGSRGPNGTVYRQGRYVRP